MKKAFFLFISCFILHFTALAQTNKIDQLSFMLGNWELKTAKGKITEHWQKSSDSLIGKSYRHQANGDSILMETLTIKKINGILNYCSQVTGQNDGQTVNFKLLPVQGKNFIFENPSHDFPQRIVYQNQGKDSMLAWIEGDKNGQKRKSEFQYRRKL
jgi:hypothetical protein